MGFFSDLDQGKQESPRVPVKKGFFSDLEEGPSRKRSLLSAFPKGLLKGAHSLGKLHDPMALLTGSQPSQMESMALEQVLPTQKGQFAEETLETAGELAPSFAIGPEGLFTKAAQIGLGAVSKNILKQAGAPEIAQDIGAAVLSVSPQALKGALSKKLLPKASQKEVYEMLKGHGFSDKDITPFIQSEKKAKWLSKFARSFLEPEKFKKETQPVADAVYGAIREKQKDLLPLKGLRKVAFMQQLDAKLQDIPYTYTDLIKKDLQKLKSSKLSFKDLSDFEAALNRKIGSEQGGKAVLGLLKEPIDFGERLLSPELHKEKSLMNKAYKSRMDIYDRLPESARGSLMEKAGKWGPVGGIALAYAFGLPFALKTYALKKGADFAAMKALTSPRFQNMQDKLLESIKSGNKGSAIQLISKMQDEVNKYFSESSVEKAPDQKGD